MVFESGCRDKAPTPAVLKNISWNSRKKARRDQNEILSLQKMVEERIDSEKILQKVLLHPRGVMLWSQRSIRLFHQRCKTDVVYIDATGSIIQKGKGKSAPFYVYELVVRHPNKGASPVPVATFVTCDHTTSSVTYFLESFQTDYFRLFGKASQRRPVMIMCDGSLVLLQAVAYSFCKISLGQLLQMYYEVVTGKLRDEEYKIPILHRCLSHVMKNAKVFCKKHCPQNYRMAMHVFGLLTSAATLVEMEDTLISMTVVFSSPQSGNNVEKHFRNLQNKMLNIGISGDETVITDDDVELDMGPTPFQRHFEHVIAEAPVHDEGEPNEYYSATFMPSLVKYFLPHAPLWSALMLGDLGRHGRGPVYKNLSKKFERCSQLDTQNYTNDNKTQGIMEKSQYDLKRVRFNRRRLTRLDDFVHIYQISHNALLKEFSDSNRKKKTHRVDVERWKQRRRSKKGIYVSPLLKPFPFKKAKKSMVLTPIAEPLTTTPEKCLEGEHLDVGPLQKQHYLQMPKDKNLGPCWHGKNPTEILLPCRLSRTQQAPKGSAITSILHPEHWLSSDEIDFASHLLAKEYKEIDGFQSSLLFSALERGGIVDVCIYDSLSTMLDNNTEQALSWMLRPMEDQFVVMFPTVQQQTNSSNCGVLAIGFAYALCSNIRPENCQFREGRMRAELIKSFRTGKVEFKIEEKLCETKIKQTTVSVHCVCRTAHNKEVMVQSSLCHGWFHPTCLNIPSDAIFGEDDWHCQNCDKS
ncbi:hypothetical protein QQF64_018571 [Cirrhinus molitorella]|uniref:Zinc finger PHD-type domain-containing protein n=1 Tax=Cirrhinus molitorella TaxID=172907 RepID=A0ABR3LD00_9TELE